MDIRVTDYEFIDKVDHGERQEKKVIAQELKEIYPQAVVDNITKVVPDIMQFAPDKAGWVNLENHNLKIGDIVRLVHATGIEELEVLAIKDNAFQVAFELEEDVLVYGRQVSDFHTVDYDAVAMLNVSATQAQQALIEQLQSENTAMKARLGKLETLQKENATLKAAQTSIQAELKDIKALLEMSASK